MRQIHAKGIVINDLSPNNILIDRRLDNVWFIDFEASHIVGEQSILSQFIRGWNTVGMRRIDSARERDPTFEDDWFSLAITLQSLMLPVEACFPLVSGAQEAFLNALVRDSGVPTSIAEVILALKNGDHTSASTMLARSSIEARKPPDAVHLMSGRFLTKHKLLRVNRVAEECRHSVSAIAKTALLTADTKRT
ncbi:hypothetical protein B2A_04843, partial [mine drainage metagenome]